jgi:hypothetical protein
MSKHRAGSTIEFSDRLQEPFVGQCMASPNVLSRRFPGDHFYLEDSSELVCDSVVAAAPDLALKEDVEVGLDIARFEVPRHPPAPQTHSYCSVRLMRSTKPFVRRGWIVERRPQRIMARNVRRMPRSECLKIDAAAPRAAI